MSIIRDHMLAGGSIGMASNAAAAAVFELAQNGYVTLKLRTPATDTVCVTRTSKPVDDDSLPEEAMLLRALFGQQASAGQRAYLTEADRIHVAQPFAAYARALLVQERYIRRLKPRTVYRSLSAVFYPSMVALLAALIVNVDSPGVAFGILVTIMFCSAFFAAFVWDMRDVRVFRTAKGKAAYLPLSALRFSSRFPRRAAIVTVTADHLPHELLWTPYGAPRSVSAGFYDVPPAWCDGDWPPNRTEVVHAFMLSLFTLAAVFRPADSNKESLGELDDVLGDALDYLTTESYEISTDVSEWSGAGDSAGGDGDGSGGDGGGDGGGGDGGGGDG